MVPHSDQQTGTPAARAKGRSRQATPSSTDHPSPGHQPSLGGNSSPNASTSCFSGDSPSPKPGHLPRPPSTKQDPDKFFRYWYDTDRSYPDRLEVYVYRLWPVIDRTRKVSANSTAAYVDIWRGAFDPQTWRDEILHRLGSGDYKLYLKDTAMKRGVCWTVVRGLNDPDYPPVVNPEELITEHPANRSYVEQLRIKGVLPRTSEQAGKDPEGSMATEAVRELAGIVRQVLEESIRSRGRSDTGATLEKSIEIVGEAAKAQSQMLANAYREALSAQNPASVIEVVRSLAEAIGHRDKTDPSQIVDKVVSMYREIKSEQGQQDPVALVERVASTLEKIVPRGPSYSEVISPLVELFKAQSQRGSQNQEVVEVMKAMLEQQRSWSEQVIRLQQQQIEQMRHELAETRKQAADNTGILSVLEKVANLKDQLSDILSGGAPDRRGPDWADTLARLSPIISPALTAIAQRVVSPAAAMPLPATQLSGLQAPNPGTPTAGQDKQLPPHQPLPAPAQQNQTAATASADPIPGLAEVIVRYINEGRTGDEFAAALVDWYGMIAYQQIRSLGAEALMQYAVSHPLLGHLALGARPQLEKFISDFVDAEQYWREDSENEYTGESVPVQSATAQQERGKTKRSH